MWPGWLTGVNPGRIVLLVTTTPGTIHPTIAFGVDAQISPPAGFSVAGNEWHGIDYTNHSRIVRLAAEETEIGSPVDLYVLDVYGVCAYSIQFSGGTPDRMIAQTVRAAFDMPLR